MKKRINLVDLELFRLKYVLNMIELEKNGLLDIFNEKRILEKLVDDKVKLEKKDK